MRYTRYDGKWNIPHQLPSHALMKFIVCDCHEHALSVSTDEPGETEPYCYLAMWYRGEGKAPFFTRARYAWRILVHGDSGPTEILLKKSMVRELIMCLQDIEKKLPHW